VKNDTGAGPQFGYELLRGATAPDDLYSEPSWSRDGKRLTFIYNFAVWTSNADGSNRRQLSAQPAAGTYGDSRPRWSPDGLRIVYRSQYNGHLVIKSMNAAGGDVKTIAADQYAHFSDPAYAPFGGKIAYVRSSYGGAGGIVVSNADGSNPVALLNWTTGAPVLYSPDWAPDATKLLYTECRDTGPVCALYIVDSDGTKRRKVTDGVSADMRNGVFSPNGKRIAYEAKAAGWHESYIRTMNIDGTDARTVAGAVSTGKYFVSPSWQRAQPPP
jgi:Tol biopolymer transport system component